MRPSIRSCGVVSTDDDRRRIARADSSTLGLQSGTDTAHIFISYSRRDATIVDRLIRELQAASVEVWIDREYIGGGATWRREIVDAIENAAAVLLALSPDAAVSDKVRKELDIAEESNKPLIPVEIRPTVIPRDMVWHLVDLQRIDAATAFEDGVRRVVESVRAFVKSPRTLARLSPEARNEIRGLMMDPGLSPSDRVHLASLIVVKESARIRDQLLAALLELDERARKRMESRDKLHRQGGSNLDKRMLEREQEEDARKRQLIMEQMEEKQKLNELVLSQLKASNSAGAQAARDIWGRQ
jgi:hypothetical protein